MALLQRLRKVLRHGFDVEIRTSYVRQGVDFERKMICLLRLKLGVAAEACVFRAASEVPEE